MDPDKKKKILTTVGLVAVVGGSVALYFSGKTESDVTAIIGVIFLAIGAVVAFFKK